MKKQHVAIVIGAIVAVIAIGSFTALTFVNQISQTSENIDAGSLVYPPDSKPYGISYDEWEKLWWQWFTAIPEKNSPAGDQTGEHCGINQNNSNAWFIAGTFQGSVRERVCEVPSDKALFGSLIGIACIEGIDGPPETLRECSRQGLDNLKYAELVIDGRAISKVKQYRTTSPLTSVTFPDGAIWGMEKGKSQVVGDGISPMIKPLSPGNHTISFKGEIDHPTNNVYDTVVDVSYTLIVK